MLTRLAPQTVSRRYAIGKESFWTVSATIGPLAQFRPATPECGEGGVSDCGNSVKDLTFSHGLFPETRVIRE
jgi:hypothetical protein